MRITRRTSVIVAGAVALALGLSACGGSSGGGGTTTNSQAPSATQNDIGATPYDQVPTGGTLKWALTGVIPNFNYNELDGTLKDNADVINALMPRLFLVDATGVPHLHTDYLAAADLKTDPTEVVTYKINPKAKWSDGTPLSWKDFEAQWKALNGTAKGYNIASSNGYDQIASVAKGANDQEAVVTYKNKYADWQNVFSPLYPASTNTDKKTFNTGWIKQPLITAGPFKFSKIDQTAKTITIVRDDSWWGKKAKLDSIIYRAIDGDAQADALANGEIDWLDIGPDVNKYTRAKSMPGVVIRRAGGPNFRHITINGTSPQLSDVNVRTALAKAIDRTRIAQALLAPLGVSPTALGNHLFMANQKGYKDNSGNVGKYDVAAAKQLLDAAGWKLNGTTRTKNGKALTIRFVIPSGVATSKQESELIQGMLAQVGVKVNIQTVPTDDFFDKYITPGNFDFTVFSWIGNAYPISSNKSIYANPKKGPDGLDIQQNFARIGSPEIDSLFDQATAELDPAKAIDIANQVDTKIWDEVHSLTTYQRPDLAAVKSTVENVGAFGFADYVYEIMGIKK